MNKRVSLLLLLAVCICLSSCAKKESANTPFTRILGTWEKVKYATDDNNNGQLDSWEINPIQPGTTNTLEFKKDNTGVEKSTYSPDLPFNWAIVGDLSVMIQYAANDTITYQIYSITSANMELTTRTNLSLAGYFYDKQ